MTYREEQIAHLELAKAISQHLPGWEVEKSDVSWNCYLVQRPGHGRLFIANSDEMVRVRGGFHHITDKRGRSVCNGHDTPEVGISKAKGPERIAKDIQRRLLGAYLAELPALLARADKWNARIDAQEKVTARLATVLGVKHDEERLGKLHLYREHQRDSNYNIQSLGLSIDVAVSEGDHGVELEANYLYPGEAEAAIRTILALRDKTDKAQ